MVDESEGVFHGFSNRYIKFIGYFDAVFWTGPTTFDAHSKVVVQRRDLCLFVQFQQANGIICIRPSRVGLT